MKNMEDFDTIEKLEEYFKKVNCYGNYNYCFTCQIEQSMLPMLFGAAGAVTSVLKNKKVMGYLFNQNDKGIGLIPIVVDTLNKNKVDLDNYIFIKQDNIKKISIKNEDFLFKKIKIELKDKTKYIIKTAKKIKNIDYHENNLNKFIEMYK
ncbi:MAG: hypothetical protein EOM50_01220 [Erysipelotrichia bacterium]|nr:hypothetical protein [Erysipelotrichia bacterium]